MLLFLLFEQETAYGLRLSLVGSEVCIRVSFRFVSFRFMLRFVKFRFAGEAFPTVSSR